MQYFQDEVYNVITEINKVRNRTNLRDFDYSHEIASYDLLEQQKIWILRTQLFYLLLISVTRMMKDRSFFNFALKKREFNVAVSEELYNYKMGIFGSLNPTSDIDVGVQYTGHTVKDGLAYIVSVVEDAFLLFTRLSSLKFDIELYADMMTITGKNGTEVFYLDSQQFSDAEFKAMLPYVEASILRNFVTAKLPEEPRTREQVQDCVKQFRYNNFFDVIREDKKLIPFFKRYLNGNYGLSKLFEDGVSPLANDLIVQYMSSTYAKAREIYYKKVKMAENEVAVVRKHYHDNHYLDLQVADIVKLMQLIAEALVFRAESYTCSDSVMHVVRVLQASGLNHEKLHSKYPKCAPLSLKLKRAFCDIGIYGYFISIFEQLGYIYRFHLTYCLKKHRDETKCERKHQKYVSRVVNALEILGIQTHNSSTTTTTKKKITGRRKSKSVRRI